MIFQVHKLAAAVANTEVESLVDIALHELVLLVPVIGQNNLPKHCWLHDIVEKQVRVHVRAVLPPQVVGKCKQLVHILIKANYCVLQKFFYPAEINPLIRIILNNIEANLVEADH